MGWVHVSLMVKQLSLINDLRKFKNSPSWLVIFPLLPLNKIPLFSKDLITFIRFFISLFVKVIPEPLIDEIPFLIFLPIISRHVSGQNLLSISLGSFLINLLILVTVQF